MQVRTPTGLVLAWRSILLPLLLLAGALPAMGQDLVLALAADKDIYRPGEPVRLTASVTNASERTVETALLLDPAYGDFRLVVSRDGGDFKGYIGPGWSTADAIAAFRPLEPGARIETEFSVLFNKTMPGRPDHLDGPFAFPGPGRYRLRGELPADGLVSEPVEITVDEPAGDDIPAWASVKENPMIALLVQAPDAAVEPEDVAAARAFTADHPKAALAALVRAALEERRDILGPEE